MEYEDDEKTSKYNAAVAQLQRLDKLWNRAHTLCLSGKMKSLFFVLERVWIELCPDAKRHDFKMQRNIYRKVNDIFAIKVNSREESEMRRNNRRKKGLLYKALQIYEIFLRRLQNTQGKGTAYRDASDEGID